MVSSNTRGYSRILRIMSDRVNIIFPRLPLPGKLSGIKFYMHANSVVDPCGQWDWSFLSTEPDHISISYLHSFLIIAKVLLLCNLVKVIQSSFFIILV